MTSDWNRPLSREERHQLAEALTVVHPPAHAGPLELEIAAMLNEPIAELRAWLLSGEDDECAA